MIEKHEQYCASIVTEVRDVRRACGLGVPFSLAVLEMCKYQELGVLPAPSYEQIVVITELPHPELPAVSYELFEHEVYKGTPELLEIWDGTLEHGVVLSFLWRNRVTSYIVREGLEIQEIGTIEKGMEAGYTFQACMLALCPPEIEAVAGEVDLDVPKDVVGFESYAEYLQCDQEASRQLYEKWVALGKGWEVGLAVVNAWL